MRHYLKSKSKRAGKHGSSGGVLASQGPDFREGYSTCPVPMRFWSSSPNMAVREGKKEHTKSLVRAAFYIIAISKMPFTFSSEKHLLINFFTLLIHAASIFSMIIKLSSC
jgi:hypothetical protein